MSKFLKSLIAAVLVVSLLITSTISVVAAAQELYVSELRLVYANSYTEAQAILADTEFKNYKLLNQNLNRDTEEIGVWLAYETTSDIEEAITDISVMQMDGGYTEGNYQQMIQESTEEYLKMGAKYKTVIEYFNKAYDAGHFLAKMAYRQLNLYTVKTIGLKPEYIPSFEGELLGDIFYDGIGEAEIATMFMEGNSHVLSNIRSLLSMGVSYNADGKTYLDKVGDEAEKMTADATIYDGKNYDELALYIVPTIKQLKSMFNDFAHYENDLNFEDEEITEDELQFAEHKALANMTREVTYLNGKTFYDFCLEFTEDKNDYSSLYPLMAALNDGQKMMTELACYYEVIRYSMSNYPEEYLEEKVKESEEVYAEKPFNIYEGVDRTIYRDTFALTSEASRNDAYTETNTLADAYFGGLKNTLLTSLNIAAGAGGIGFMIWGAFEKKAENAAALALKNEITARADLLYQTNLADLYNTFGVNPMPGGSSFYGYTPDQLLTGIIERTVPDLNMAGMTFADKFEFFSAAYHEVSMPTVADNQAWLQVYRYMDDLTDEYEVLHAQDIAAQVREATTTQMATSSVLFLVGGAMLLYSALMLSLTVINYYNPDYDDVPTSLVDLHETTHGDRYIKYDVVYEAESREENEYAPADLNAYEAQRWIALYYTKSYEAGNPLLADTFKVSTSSNKPAKNYVPVNRFGEVVCYNLNTYNYDGNTGVYLSLKASENQKYAASGVPDVVGSMISNDFGFLIGGLGALLGAMGTLSTQAIIKKKKTKTES